MFGLVSPMDIHRAVTQAEKIEGLNSRLDDLASRTGAAGGAAASGSFENLLLSSDPELFRPETALLSAMDEIYQSDEERRTGKTTTSAFDEIISAQVASALGPVY